MAKQVVVVQRTKTSGAICEQKPKHIRETNNLHAYEGQSKVCKKEVCNEDPKNVKTNKG